MHLRIWRRRRRLSPPLLPLRATLLNSKSGPAASRALRRRLLRLLGPAHELSLGELNHILRKAHEGAKFLSDVHSPERRAIGLIDVLRRGVGDARAALAFYLAVVRGEIGSQLQTFLWRPFL